MNRRGVTLIELLVAMVLTTIVAWMALRMFAGEQQNFTRTREKVKMQADAREAMRIMDEEIRNAGYAVQMSTSNRIEASPASCPEVLFPSTGGVIDPGNNSTSYSVGDTILFRLFELPSSGTLTSCTMGSTGQFREIGYRLDNGVLKRRFRKDTTSSVSWIPFLQNVVSFQVRYGLVEDTNNIVFDTAKLRNKAFWNPVTNGASMLTLGGTAPTLEFSGFGSTTNYAYFGPIDSSRAGESYRVSMKLMANDSLLDSINGYDTTHFMVGLVKSGLTLYSCVGTFKLGQVANAALPYEFYFSVNGTLANGRYLFLGGRLRSGATAGAQTLTVTDLKVERISRGSYFTWVNSPSKAEMARVAAVRVSLVVKTAQNAGESAPQSFTVSQLGDLSLPSGYTASSADYDKSHILYQRIIPVVNNRL